MNLNVAAQFWKISQHSVKLPAESPVEPFLLTTANSRTFDPPWISHILQPDRMESTRCHVKDFITVQFTSSVRNGFTLHWIIRGDILLASNWLIVAQCILVAWLIQMIHCICCYSWYRKQGLNDGGTASPLFNAQASGFVKDRGAII